MKIKLGTLILLLLLTSCAKKQVKIPKIALHGAEQVANHSQIWLFYNEQGKLTLNEKNRISSTNWFFNIDKRLILREVMPEVKRLFIKHNTKSPHNTAPMSNYYSYANSLNDKLSFYQFDSIQYQFIKVTELPNYTKISDTILFKIISQDVDFTNLPLKTDTVSVVQMAFYNDISFQQYLSAKAKIEKRIAKKQLSTVELLVAK